MSLLISKLSLEWYLAASDSVLVSLAASLAASDSVLVSLTASLEASESVLASLAASDSDLASLAASLEASDSDLASLEASLAASDLSLGGSSKLSLEWYWAGVLESVLEYLEALVSPLEGMSALDPLLEYLKGVWK